MSEPIADFDTLRVLVVDDDPLVQEMTRDALADLGVGDTRCVGDGVAALAQLDWQPDVVMCDLNMPGMDGVALMRELAGRPFNGSLILITGESHGILNTATQLARAHALRLLAAIEKPITQAALRNALHSQPQQGESLPLVPRLDITPAAVRAAVTSRQFAVHYQPKVRCDDGRLAGAEALVRWEHPVHGLIRPDEFISIAEDSGLIHPLTEFVVRQVFSDLAELEELDPAGFTVAINLSARNLDNTRLLDLLTGLAAEIGVAPSAIILEVTEGRVASHPFAAVEMLTRLRLRGFRLSIDDFGTGYSSMEQLRTIPFNELKIDQSFVRLAGEERSALAVVEASLGLARKMDLVTVAEGVEEEQHLDLIRSMGVDLVQGYLIARPMPLSEFTAWARGDALPGHDVDCEKAAELPVWDPTLLQQMVGPDEFRAQRYLARLAEQVDEATAALRAAVDSGARTAIVDVTHRIKSSARGLGALRLGEAADQLETAAHRGGADSIRSGFQRFAAAAAELQELLARR